MSIGGKKGRTWGRSVRSSFYFMFLVSSEKTEGGEEEGAEEEDEEVKVTTIGKTSLCFKHRGGEQQ